MKVVLFGAGMALGSKMEYKKLHFAEIVAVVDNNERLWGAYWQGHRIESPSVLKNIKFDKLFITSQKYYDEIYADLTERYGIAPEYINSLECLAIPDCCNMGDVKVDCDGSQCYIADELMPHVMHSENRLVEFFFHKEHRLVDKWWHYFEIYNSFFQKFVEKPVKMLEIGVFKGGSLQMWKNYFGKDAIIVGVDIDDRCASFEEEQIHIRIGSQADTNFLKKVLDEFGPFDIVLDDGSHITEHQILSFETLFPNIAEGGIYMCEDVHTSYWDSYGGGLKREGSFIEYAKSYIDGLHSQYITEQGADMPNVRISDMVKAVIFFDSIVVFEKTKKRGISFRTQRGATVQ